MTRESVPYLSDEIFHNFSNKISTLQQKYPDSDYHSIRNFSLKNKDKTTGYLLCHYGADFDKFEDSDFIKLIVSHKDTFDFVEESNYLSLIERLSPTQVGKFFTLVYDKYLLSWSNYRQNIDFKLKQNVERFGHIRNEWLVSSKSERIELFYSLYDTVESHPQHSN